MCGVVLWGHLPSKLILEANKNLYKDDDGYPSKPPPLRCHILPWVGLSCHLMQMPVHLAIILVVSGQVLLKSGIVDLFRLPDSRLIALCFLLFREDGEVLP